MQRSTWCGLPGFFNNPKPSQLSAKESRVCEIRVSDRIIPLLCLLSNSLFRQVRRRKLYALGLGFGINEKLREASNGGFALDRGCVLWKLSSRDPQEVCLSRLWVLLWTPVGHQSSFPFLFRLSVLLILYTWSTNLFGQVEFGIFWSPSLRNAAFLSLENRICRDNAFSNHCAYICVLKPEGDIPF